MRHPTASVALEACGRRRSLAVCYPANGRASALVEAERSAAAEQGRVQRERFLTPGAGYQPGNARMFNN